MSLNVNHTVDSAEPDDGTQEAPEMKSRPNFEVDIVKPDGKTLSFSCSYIAEHEDQGQPEEGLGKFSFLTGFHKHRLTLCNTICCMGDRGGL